MKYIAIDASAFVNPTVVVPPESVPNRDALASAECEHEECALAITLNERAHAEIRTCASCTVDATEENSLTQTCLVGLVTPW